MNHETPREQPPQPTNEDIERYKREKREELNGAFEEILSSGSPLFFRGSWAGELLSGVPSEHWDIDFYIDNNELGKFNEFLVSHGFKIEKSDGKFLITKGRALFDCHPWREEGDYFVGEGPHGTFYFPKEGFITIETESGPVNIMSPELMWIMKKGGPNLDSKRKANLDKLEGFLNTDKLKIISDKFKFIPPSDN